MRRYAFHRAPNAILQGPPPTPLPAPTAAAEIKQEILDLVISVFNEVSMRIGVLSYVRLLRQATTLSPDKHLI